MRSRYAEHLTSEASLVPAIHRSTAHRIGGSPFNSRTYQMDEGERSFSLERPERSLAVHLMMDAFLSAFLAYPASFCFLSLTVHKITQGGKGLWQKQ